MRHRFSCVLTLCAFVAAALAACNSSSSTSNPSSPPRGDNAGSATAASSYRPGPPKDPREPVLGEAISGVLESEHLRARKLDDEVSRIAFVRYLESLDPDKLYLLEEHVDQLRVHAEHIDDQMRGGSFELAYAGGELFAERLDVVAGVVDEVLAEPLDFSDDETIETNPDKREWATTEEELAERWRKSLELQVLSRVVRMEETAESLAEAPDSEATRRARGEIPETREAREEKARTELAESYKARFARLSDDEPIDRIAAFVNAVAGVYDPHTNYLPPRTKENFDIRMSGSLEGIGAVLQEDDHFIRVVSIVPGGASWRQGELEAGDLILSVAQEGEESVDVGDMRIDKVVKMIRGPKGTGVILTVQKPDDRVEVISITRDVVEIEEAYARGAILDAGKGTKKKFDKVGYINVPSFYGNTRRRRGNTPDRDSSDDVKKLLDLFAKRGVTSVILDLRGNGGGLLDDAQEMAGHFIAKGPIVETRAPDGSRIVLRDEDETVSFDGHVVVMVDRFSASASEIVAGALQDYQRAVVIGTGPTHGKGTVQVLLDLDRVTSGVKLPLGVFKVTTQQFFRVNGASTQWRGVLPDIVLPDPFGHIESGERFLDHSIPWSMVEALEYEPWPYAAWDVEALDARSQARQDEEKAFSTIAARNELLLERRGETVMPLELEAFLARRERDADALEKVTPELEEGPARFAVEVIDYDGPGAAGNGEKAKKAQAERDKRWREQLSHDPWIQETIYVLHDMAGAAKP